jgi:hypothetical protein
MPNYKDGKIYKITAEGYDDYYGSTTLTLENRFRAFKNTKKHYSCSPLLPLESCKIELVELFPCDSRKELVIRERFWTDNNPCINEVRPIRTDLEKVEYHKQYNKNYKRKTPQAKPSKEKNAEYCKRWYLKKKSEDI